MTRLKELRLHGFKTFAEPTRFVFGRGVNAVIGPNGSGKSNMADAVRWVLGEQSNRSLRTRRADDVIFGGSESRRPQGMAEVILTLDNAERWLPLEFGEVSIGRRAFRSGESEYLINGAAVRRRDVVELLAAGRLAANELVVVGQGTVDAALSLRPDERRQLFEEAAGVKNLQVRKNEALSQLAAARDNLERVADLVDQLKPQVRRLAIQAQHQEEHDSLGASARWMVVELHRRREMAARAAVAEARRAADAAEVALSSLRTAESAELGEVDAAEQRYWQAEAAARTAASDHEQSRETRVREEARIEGLRSRIGELALASDRSREELAATERTLAAWVADADETAMTAALAEASSAESEWRAANEQLAVADATLLEAEQALADLRHRESRRIAGEARRSEVLTRHEARRDRIAEELRAAEIGAAAARAEIGPANVALTAAESLRTRLERKAQDAARDVTQTRTAAEATRNSAAELAARIGALQSELDTLQDQAERGATRLGSLLAASGWRTLLDSLEPPAEAWPAIEALLGGELEQALLWRDGDLAGPLEGARGGAMLLSVEETDMPSSAADRAAAMAAVGGARTLAEWINAPQGPRIFSRTVVARDVASLLSGWRKLPAGWSAVTAQGDLADSRGLVSVRGRRDEAGSQAARRHERRRDASEMLRRLEIERELATRSAAAAAAAQVEARHHHDAATASDEEALRAIARLRSQLEATTASVDRSDRDVADLAREQAVAEGEMGEATLRDPLDVEAGEDLRRLREIAEAARLEREARAQQREEARSRWLDARTAADAGQSRSLTSRERRAAAEAGASHLRSLVPQHAEALARAEDDLLLREQRLAEARATDELAAERRATSDRERDRLRAELLAIERARTLDASRRSGLERAGQAAAIELSRAEDALLAIDRERQLALDSFDLATPTPDAAPAPDLAALRDEDLEADLRRVRRTLGAIGSVNPFAVEEHRELAGRLDGMLTQQRDLGTAIGSTLELIARLESEIAVTFDAAFGAIGSRFNEFCRLLFAGGSAALEVVAAADGELGGGIEIVVQPPGKRPQRLAMLSGGERALTGVALLFAMLSVNPVPFCILDEVDAALDEANIGRFADALRGLSRDTDFVVVTHNRATIEVADTIYGVTMSDAAVSRVLSLQLADLPSEALVG